MERIDQIKYQTPYEGPGTTLFLDGPTEFLVSSIAAKLSATSQWKALFGDSIYPYLRMDFSIRELPGLRIYNQTFTKTGEDWFIEGDVKIDVIFPASIRRDETQQLQDTITAALLQQFREPTFFEELGVLVPGLNELGKIFSVDKSLGFDWGQQIVPMTQVTINFKIDLRQWDRYLEETYRTKDSPFVKVLGDLNSLITTIEGLRDDMTV